MSSYEISLFNVLKKKNNNLASRLEIIREIVRKLLVYTQSKFPYYTPHGFTHSENVETCLNWLINDDLKEKFEPVEIFLLILGAWLHDWGMIGTEDEDPEKIRETHHLRSEEFINKKYEKIRISQAEAIILGKICRAHRTTEDLNSSYYDIMSIGQGLNVDVRYLSALIRIADEFDMTANRVPEIVYYQLDPSSKAEEEFKKHLQVIGIAYVSESQKYKVMISAIARDPKGAEVMENLKDNLQYTLNTVKSILARRKLIIDIVELNLTCQGFIHKPIKFELNDHKIVELLIGNHLYKNHYASIRELIQNSIDACKSKRIIKTDFPCKIILRKLNNNILEIEDNGMGMDFKNAKNFLSCIGDSFYNTDEFKEMIKSFSMTPISKFGIGILSTFLIAKSLIVETKREGEDPCKFTINSSKDMWKYEKGFLEDSGTRIILELKDEFKDLSIEEILRKYIGVIEIPLFYQEFNDELKEYKIRWTIEDIIKFHEGIIKFGDKNVKEVWKFENDNFRVLLGSLDQNLNFLENGILFNQGIFINTINLSSFHEKLLICIDLKKDLIDLKISREDVDYNDRLISFLRLLYKTLFISLKNQFINNDNSKKYFEVTRFFIQKRVTHSFYDFKDFEQILENEPFLIEFFGNICYPIYTNTGLEWKTIDDVFKNEEIHLFKPIGKNFTEELELIKTYLLEGQDYVIDIWNFRIRLSTSRNKSQDVIFRPFHYFNNEHKKINEFDLLDIIQQNILIVDDFLEDISPPHVKFARFPTELNALILYERTKESQQKKDQKIYYTLVDVELKLLESIFTETRLPQIMEILKSEFDHEINIYDSIENPDIYININDPFIRDLYEKKKEIYADKNMKEAILSYINYLYLLPLFIRALSRDYLIFLLYDYIESNLSRKLGIDKPDLIIKRMGKIGNLVLNYWDNFLLDDILSR